MKIAFYGAIDGQRHRDMFFWYMCTKKTYPYAITEAMDLSTNYLTFTVMMNKLVIIS